MAIPLIEQYHIGTNWDKFESYRTNQSKGLLTGFKQIDRAIIGLPGLVCVMGEPKSCKSTFVMNVAMHNAACGVPVILFDKENGLQRTRLRMLCFQAGLSTGAVKSGNFFADEQARYAQAAEHIKKLPIYYTAAATTEEIEKLIAEIGRHHKKHVLLIADSIQSLAEDFHDRRASVDYWIKAFNELKLKYENYLTILMVSEKKRDAYGMSSKSGAKESGAIEYKAEMVLDMYPTKDIPGIVIDCVFNRDGDTGTVCRLQKSEPYTYKLSDSEYLPD